MLWLHIFTQSWLNSRTNHNGFLCIENLFQVVRGFQLQCRVLAYASLQPNTSIQMQKLFMISETANANFLLVNFFYTILNSMKPEILACSFSLTVHMKLDCFKATIKQSTAFLLKYVSNIRIIVNVIIHLSSIFQSSWMCYSMPIY